MKVPSFMLKQIYVRKSLKNEPNGATFHLKNGLANATIIRAPRINVDGKDIESDRVFFIEGSQEFPSPKIGPANPIEFKKGVEVAVRLDGLELPPGKHKIRVDSDTKEWETLNIEFEDSL
jgi:hypothetical protein